MYGTLNGFFGANAGIGWDTGAVLVGAILLGGLLGGIVGALTAVEVANGGCGGSTAEFGSWLGSPQSHEGG